MSYTTSTKSILPHHVNLTPLCHFGPINTLNQPLLPILILINPNVPIFFLSNGLTQF